jgi:two-component system, chemotaxis family, chemotaxis protein CheY
MNVLIVDDSKAMRMIVRRTLRQAGFDVDVAEASNGQEALEMLRTGSFDAVLCDWNMPEMTGIQLLKRINDEDISVPFGFVTSEASPEMLTAAYDAGAKFMIRKPFKVDTFRHELNAVL